MSRTIKLLKQNSGFRRQGKIPPGMMNLMPVRRFSRLKVLLYSASVLFVIMVAIWGYVFYDAFMTDKQQELIVQNKPAVKKNVELSPTEKVKPTDVEVAEKVAETETSVVEDVAGNGKMLAEEEILKQKDVESAAQQVEDDPAILDMDDEPALIEIKENDPVILNGYLTQASKAYFKGNMPEAATLYEKVLKHKKNSTIVNNLLVVYVKSGAINKAAGFIRENSGDIDDKKLSELILELVSEGKTAIAGAFYQKVKDFDTTGFILYAGGFLAEDAGNKELAMKRYEQSYRNNSEDINIAYMYARSLDLSENYLKALDIYKKVSEMRGDKDILRNAEMRQSQLEEYLSTLSNH